MQQKMVVQQNLHAFFHGLVSIGNSAAVRYVPALYIKPLCLVVARMQPNTDPDNATPQRNFFFGSIQ
jgi:hypothetical protein